MAFFLPVLTFHAIEDTPSVFSMLPTVFRRGLANLSHNGYKTISLTEAAEILRKGLPFPDFCFVITFDDGYQSVYTEAFSVLEEYGMTATVFITVGQRNNFQHNRRLPSLNGRSMLSWKEIQKMHRSGIDFGAHTSTHPDLTRIEHQRAKSEITNAKALISDVLGTTVESFAYPYGHYNRQVRDFVQRHFACACSDNLGLLTKYSDLYSLERVDTYYLRNHRQFDIMLTKLFPAYILARNIPRRIKRTIQRCCPG